MDASCLYEGALGVGDKLVHVQSKSRCHHFGDKLGDRMDETNGPKIGHLLGPIFFGYEGDICGI